jgi:thiamine-phosphate pyrophosphorylase
MITHIPKIYCFIDDLNKDYITKLKKNIAIIFRNYDKKININEIIKFKQECKKNNRLFFLSNNIKIAIRLDLNGAYIPAFNTKINLNFNKKKGFIILGSAHSVKEIKIKEKQGVDCIFISPIFLTSKSNKFLGLTKFKKLSNHTNKKIIALGGLSKKNLNQIKNLNVYGYASISLFKSF